ncbi:MAG: hypothetical protein ACRD0K_09515 [Egibacteraceae bacterium]
MPPGLIHVAQASLALATGWRAALVLSDHRQISRAAADLSMYRPGLGWTSAGQLGSRRRWARAGLVAAAGLMLTLPGLAGGAVPAALASMLACLSVVAWVGFDRRLHNARYTSICIAMLALGVLLYQVGVMALGDSGDSSPAAGIFASVFASQLYLVAGIRKLRSRHFMTGRVLLDNVAYCTFQAAAGNHDFVKIVRPQRLPSLLQSSTFLFGCRLAAILTAFVELAIGLGAAGLLPRTVTLGLAIPTNLAFLLLSPRRVMPFTAAALGLLALATAHPLLKALV